MLKRILPSVLTAALALTGLAASAQNVAPERGRNWCGTVAEQERYFATHPGAREAQTAYYQQLEAMAQAQQRSTAGTAYVTDVTIPVVVHVIHSGGADNISDQQINSAIDQLNIDYEKRNADTISILPLFRARAAAVGFRFRLARKDPNGNCTTGITRHYAPNLVNDDQSGAVQALVIWDRLRYLNIWIVGSIGTPSAGGTILGYSNLPQNSTSVRDGFVERNDFFGTLGTSTPARGTDRTGTHEIGHYFGLSHTWGQTNNPGTGDCSGTDFVADTPPTDGTFDCNLTYAPCSQVANVQNIMDYACEVMFTEGQKQLMRNVLATSPVRTTLTTQANLVATGTNDGYVAPDCAPIVAFAVAPGSTANVCINTPVTLRDYSSNFTASGGTVSYDWSFPGGTPSRASGQTATVQYAAGGFYPVTETVTNSIGSNTTTVTNYIRVEGATGGETAPYTESFEDANFPNLFPAPTLRNYTISGATSTGAALASTWQRQTAFPASDGTAYLRVNNRVYPVGAVTTLITPNINLTGVAQAVLRFDRAYALATATSNDQLRVAFSNDCGLNWTSGATLTATDLSTQRGPVNGYSPSATTDWVTLTVPIPAQFQGGGLFKVRLQMVNGTTAQGNIFYLDKLRVVSGVLATKADALASRGISVFPNPLTNETAVRVNLTAATQVQVQLTDLLGRTVLSLPAKTYGAGLQTLPLQTAGHPLSAGVYVVRIALDGETFTSKLTVE